jgi:hypothetical protein
MRHIQEKYGEQGMLKDWDKMSKIADPKHSQKFFETVKKYNILPDNLDGFVFLSPSANMGSKEIDLARIIDQQVGSNGLNKNPLVIASDFFGMRNREGDFKPRFNIENIPDLKNVDFSFVSADANELPIKDGAVDMIMDRMGAVWHTINSCLSSEGQPITEMSIMQKNEAKEKVKKILSHYLSKLKDNGNIILDAPDDGRESTALLLFTVFGEDIKEELEQIGLEYSFVGENENELLVLRKLTVSEG